MQVSHIRINLIKIAILLFVFKALLGCQHPELLTIPPVIDAACIGVGIVVFLLKVFSYRFGCKDFFLFAGCGLFVLFTCYQIKQYDLLISFITIFLLRDENLDEYVRMIFKYQIIMMIAIFGAMSVYHFGYFEHIYWYRLLDRTSFMACMSHPNILATCVISLMLMYVWLNFEDFTFNKYLALITVTVILFLLTDTRTTFILSLFFLSFMYWMRGERVKIIISKYLKFLFPSMGIAVFFLIKQYINGNAWLLWLDSLVSGRIKLGSYAYYHSGIAILPRMLEYARDGIVQWEQQWQLNAFAFDNLYSFIWIQLGVVWFVFISVFIHYLIKKTDYKCHCFIMLWIIYGFTEVQGLSCYRFFPLLLAVKIFDEIKEKEKAVEN